MLHISTVFQIQWITLSVGLVDVFPGSFRKTPDLVVGDMGLPPFRRHRLGSRIRWWIEEGSDRRSRGKGDVLALVL